MISKVPLMLNIPELIVGTIITRLIIRMFPAVTEIGDSFWIDAAVL